MRPYFYLVLRLFLGAVFLLSGGSKIVDTHAFAATIRDFGFFSEEIITLASVGVPAVEMVAGTLLMLGLWMRTSCILVISLLSLFILIIIPNVAVGNVTPCGCFGSLIERSTDASLLIQDAILLTMALLLFRFDRQVLSLDNVLQKRREARA